MAVMTTARGGSPVLTWLRFGVGAIVAGVVLGLTVPSAVDGLATAWSTNRQALVWLFERLFAWMAYIAMTGSVVYGLLLTTKLLDRLAHRPVTYHLHQDLASVGVGLAGVHGFLLGLDHSMPFSIAQILVPGLSPHATLGVAFGQVALYLAGIVLVSFYLRPHLPQKAWRALHYLTFLAFVGATVHGIVSGTDSSEGWAQWIYIGSGAVVAFLLAYRIALSAATHSGFGPVSRAEAELERTLRR
jgi:methionine sulfoxide reductase heme-binding subunit